VRRRKKKVPIFVDEKTKELLEKEFGSASKGVEELVRRYTYSLGPEDPELRKAWEILLRHVEADGLIRYEDALDVLCYEMSLDRDYVDRKIIAELSAQGYVHMVETGVLKVFRKAVLPSVQLLYMLGLRRGRR